MRQTKRTKDDENKDNFDLNEAELLQFTQHFSKYDKAFGNLESEEGKNLPPQIDFSQDLDAFDVGDDDSKGYETNGDNSHGSKERQFYSKKDSRNNTNINSSKQPQEELPNDTKVTYDPKPTTGNLFSSIGHSDWDYIVKSNKTQF